MRAHALVSLTILVLAFAAPPPVHADAPDRLSIRPWVELEPFLRIGPGPYPIPVDTAEKSLLEIARVLVSGMVYGWTFDYQPGDRARRVQESFVLTSLAQVLWGSPRLQVTETEVTETRLWARVVYSLDDEESRRREAWDSTTADLSTGQGTAPIQDGDAARQKSLESAIRDAIRRSLDTRYANKPRNVRGEVVLWTDPVVTVRTGTWITSATVKILVREIVPYRIF